MHGTTHIDPLKGTQKKKIKKKKAGHPALASCSQDMALAYESKKKKKIEAKVCLLLHTYKHTHTHKYTRVHAFA